MKIRDFLIEKEEKILEFYLEQKNSEEYKDIEKKVNAVINFLKNSDIPELNKKIKVVKGFAKFEEKTIKNIWVSVFKNQIYLHQTWWSNPEYVKTWKNLDKIKWDKH